MNLGSLTKLQKKYLVVAKETNLEKENKMKAIWWVLISIAGLILIAVAIKLLTKDKGENSSNDGDIINRVKMGARNIGKCCLRLIGK